MKAKTEQVVAGKIYHSLTLTGGYSFIKTNEGRRLVVEAKCKCGVVKNYPLRYLQTGNTKSCGCVKWEKLRASNITHSLTKHPLYQVYQDMKRRCYDPTSKSYKYYGAIGIKVCDEWLNSIKAFCDWGIENGFKEGLEIDRIENSKGYELSNIRFVSRAIGNTNTRKTRPITAFGLTMTAAEWSRNSLCSISEKTLTGRINSKWKVEDAITAPSNERKKEQARNSKSARRIAAWGEEKSIIEWSEDPRCKVGYSGLKNRLNKGVTPENAISGEFRK